MTRWRILVPLLLLTLLLLVLVPSLHADDTRKRAELSEERDAVRVVGEEGKALFEYTLSLWRSWAEENLVQVLGGPVRIGEQEMSPSTFDAFGAAELSPSGKKLALSTTTYAMLTTVSVVGVLDLFDRSFTAVEEPAYGGLEEFLWSPQGEYIAYSLGTARASGDGLRIDDVEEFAPVVMLSGADLLEEARSLDLEVPPEPRQWLPHLRDLEWSGEGRLLFTTDGFAAGEGELRWSISSKGDDLSLET